MSSILWGFLISYAHNILMLFSRKVLLSSPVKIYHLLKSSVNLFSSKILLLIIYFILNMALKILGLLLHTNFLIFYTKHFIKCFLIWLIFSMGLSQFLGWPWALTQWNQQKLEKQFWIGIKKSTKWYRYTHIYMYLSP